MYQCQRCHDTIPSKTPGIRIVSEVHTVHHPARSYRLRRAGKPYTDAGGIGTQIVRELLCCPACAAQVGPPR